MPDEPQMDRLPEDDSSLHPAELLQIDIPVIDIQDLEHKATPETRVSNKGVRVEPRIDNDDLRDLAKEEEEALAAMEEIEKSIKGLLPG